MSTDAHVELRPTGAPVSRSLLSIASATSSRGASSSTNRSPSGVEQRRALAAHGLGDEEAVAGAVAHERGGVELHELEVGEVRARRVGERQPDADRARRVGRAPPERGRAAGGEHGGRARRSRARRSSLAAVTPTQRPSLIRSADAVVCSNTSMRSCVAASAASWRVIRRPVARAAGVHDAALRVPALEPEREAAAAVAVEAHAQRLELAHPARRVLAQHLHRARAGGAAARR